ncbi:MAG: nitroreductase family protein [Candidatus Pacearchaeota archaeon]
MELGEAIKKRRSIRNFSVKEPIWREIIEVLDYARYAPMAGNLFSVKFIFVSDKEKIKKIAEACQQEFVGKVHYLIVVVSDRESVKKNYDFFDKQFGAQQAGAAIQNVLLGLTEKGLATCWVGFFDEPEIKRVLSIPEKICVEAILPIGYEHKFMRGREKEKINLDSIVFFEKYGKKHMGEDTMPRFDNS